MWMNPPASHQRWNCAKRRHLLDPHWIVFRTFPGMPWLSAKNNILTFNTLNMKKVILVFFGLAVFSASAQDEVVVPGISGMLGQAQANIVALAEAFGEDQMDWRPAEGIRSVGETILHTAAANYYIAMKMGYAPPEGIDIMTMEQIQGKQAIIDTFKQSSEFIQEKIKTMDTETFGEEVDLGFGTFNRLSSVLIILEHTGEHKGQLIAYARSNGVVLQPRRRRRLGPFQRRGATLEPAS